MKVQINLNGEEQLLDVTRRGEQVRIVRDGVTSDVTLREVNGASCILEYNGRLIRVAGAKQGEKRQIWLNGRTFSYERIQKRAGGAGAQSKGSLSSLIPAVVSEILVNVGDAVKAGDKLILLESMKMIIPIQAPADGTVQEIKCAAGESIQPGIPLVIVG